MFQEPNQGADALIRQPALLPEFSYESGRHLLLGSLIYISDILILL